MKEMVGGCCVCSDERGWPDNPLVYCDGNGCTVAVHQACYGIVTVPTGPWYCRKCESPENKGKVRCELCPSKSGALKRSDTGGWAHVVCALYIPEVRFGDVTSMEPIVLRLIPQERYNKQCYICQDSHKSHRATAGACMQCNKAGCKQQFHVTCAQSLGLLCEEAGNYLDNVKYCGYCQHHYSKLKKGGNVKTIPPYKPVSHDSQSSDSSCEKEGEGSPMAGRCETPTPKSKGPGRKSSYTGSASSGKNTPNTSKSSTSNNQQSNKKKPSPARRGSSASDAGKAGTPAQSPQDSESANATKASGRATPSGSGSKSASPGGKSEPVGVISSVASATGAASTSLAPTVVQAPSKPYQESVITNTDSVETKQTKKRKALTASAAAAIDYAPAPPTGNDQTSQTSGSSWESPAPVDVQMDSVEKVIKKAKTEGGGDNSANAQYLAHVPLPPPPPPPPAYSPAAQPSPRHLQSPLPGPSGMNPPSHIRSPSRPQVSAATEMPAPPPHIFHQPQKLAAMEPSVPGHASHGAPGRGAWAGLNVSYEMQDHNKSAASSLSSKEMPMPSAPPPMVRNKKRAAMAASSAASAAAAAAAAAMASMPSTTVSTQSLASVRRLQMIPPPPPIYQETIKDSPPSSPGSERPLKPKQDNKSGVHCTAPHMLGNELNPESGAAARLQEQLTAELAAHAAGGGAPDLLVPPPLINKALPGSSRSGSSGAQSLDQLLERQWEQGSQFLMEQAQHFDIASLLSCLHQLRTENVRLEEHVGSLLQRRDHLLAVNARLAIPLNTVSASPPEPARCNRENGAQARAPPAPTPAPLAADRPHQLIMREVQQKPS